MTFVTCASDSSVRNTWAPLSISSCSSLRIAAMRSGPFESRGWPGLPPPARAGVGGERREVDVLDVLDRVAPGALAEDVDVEQRVGAEAVRSVHRDAGALAGGGEAGQGGRVVAQHL